MIINFQFLQYFLLEHDNLISCKYFVTFYENFDLIFIKYYEF